HDAVGDDREYTDRMPKGQGCAKQPHEGWVQGRNAPTEVISEALARAADAGREVFGQNRAHAGENARGEKAEREAQEEHHRIRDWKLRVNENRDHPPNREYN